ncbi:MAG: chorismate synthase, partial [Candidatus Omnitrophica bacterium]|nr:chorismate synthase [Candidatus Omnitrophota bacterium]
MLRQLTAGESHGRGLIAILEGLPAGLKIDPVRINQELKRRQSGFGRGKRMEIENDRVQIISGLKKGVTIASPIALLIQNKDRGIEKLNKVLSPRPGHADLAGLLKYGFSDCREVLERASARSTASTVSIGAVCKIFLENFKVKISSQVLLIGGESDSALIKDRINEAFIKKDTLGGIFEVV